jgi:hypothetical protein
VEFAGSAWPTFASLYPGDRYVDWTCLDGCNWGSNYPGKTGWIAFKDLDSYSYYRPSFLASRVRTNVSARLSMFHTISRSVAVALKMK